MRTPPLIRRREIWLPTAAGWALLAALVLGAGWLGLRGIYGFLAPERPVGRGLLVVEGWLTEDAFDEVVRIWRHGGYTKLVTTGGPIERGACPVSARSYAEYASQALRARGLPPEVLAVVPSPPSARERTFLSAVLVREWIEQNRADARALDVVSQGAHARRSWSLYRMAFGDGAAVGIRATAPDGYDGALWWRTSSGAKEVISEAIAWTWTACCFHPGPRGSLEEKWGRE